MENELKNINSKSGVRELFEYLAKDEDFRRAYNSPSIAHSSGRSVAEARVSKRMTQKELAKLIGTKQPNIARIERGEIDSLVLLGKIAKALNTELIAPTFTCINKIKFNDESSFQVTAADISDATNNIAEAHDKTEDDVLQVYNSDFS